MRIRRQYRPELGYSLTHAALGPIAVDRQLKHFRRSYEGDPRQVFWGLADAQGGEWTKNSMALVGELDEITMLSQALRLRQHMTSIYKISATAEISLFSALF